MARETVIAFIREHKDQGVPFTEGVAGLRWGAEPMCAILIAGDVLRVGDKQPTAQQLRDERVTALIRAERQDPKTAKFAATLGPRKMRLRSKGHDVARCTIERLMRAGVGGRRRRPSAQDHDR